MCWIIYLKADDDCLQEWIYDQRDAQEARQDLAAWLLKWGQRYPKLCAGRQQ